MITEEAMRRLNIQLAIETMQEETANQPSDELEWAIHILSERLKES